MFFNEIRDALRKSDTGGQPTKEDMKELRRHSAQIAALSDGTNGLVSKLKGQDHAYAVGAGIRFRIEGDTVIPL